MILRPLAKVIFQETLNAWRWNIKAQPYVQIVLIRNSCHGNAGHFTAAAIEDGASAVAMVERYLR